MPALRTAILAISITTALALAGALMPDTPARATAVTLTASPTGTGTACTSSSPCALATALSAAGAGSTVLLLSGCYGSSTLIGPGGASTAPLVVRPATGAVVSFTSLISKVPSTTWTGGIVVTHSLYLYPQATHTIVDGLHMVGAGAFLRASHTIVRNSTFTGGVDVDAVQIKDGSDIRFEANTVDGYTTTGGTVHVDCVQVFDTAAVVIVRNTLRNCSNTAIILSAGNGLGIHGITIQSNFIQGCMVPSASCFGGSTIDLRELSASNVVVRNNTILDGPTRLMALPGGLSFDRNIVGYLADCGAPMTDTLLLAWSTKDCLAPLAMGSNGNVLGTVAFANRAAGDLHVLSRAQVTLVTTVPRVGTVRGFDNIALQSTTAGADD
jgi:hypothetical protein